jgi:putative MATE family efflux protein
MMAAMLLMSLYTIVNAIWVAGLGPDALAAVGFMTPVFMILIGLGNGLGAGVSSAIARRIGAGDRDAADRTAMHGMAISLSAAAVLTVPLVLYTEQIAAALGAGTVAPLAAEYGRVLFSGAVFVLFTNIAYAILRGEGDTKRTMYAMVASSIVNAVLDPILIYTLGFGIAGAALATVISIALVSAVILYWFVVKKDTYVALSLRESSFDSQITGDILRVGLPASLEFFLMSLLSILVNGVLVIVAGTDGVAVYSSGWRLAMFGIIPLLALSTTLVSVAAAAYGGRTYRKLSEAFGYAVRLGTVIAAITAAMTWFFAPQIAYVFTYAEATAYLEPTIVAFLRVISLFFIAVPMGIMSVAIFQGTGRGLISLALNVLRNLAFNAVFVYLFGIVLGYGETGVWFGIVCGNIAGSLISYGIARLYVSRLIALEPAEKPGGAAAASERSAGSSAGQDKKDADVPPIG